MSEAISQDRERCQLLFRLMKNAMLYRAARAESGRFILVIRDTKGDAKAAEEATRNFEQEKVNLIYTTRTSVTIAAKRATTDIPIVFCAGTDPVVLGLVDSFAKSGGRLTGVYEPGTDITAKRLEILKEIVAKLRQIVTFHCAEKGSKTIERLEQTKDSQDSFADASSQSGASLRKSPTRVSCTGERRRSLFRKLG